LTCVFWAENAKNKWKDQKKKQILNSTSLSAALRVTKKNCKSKGLNAEGAEGKTAEGAME